MIGRTGGSGGGERLREAGYKLLIDDFGTGHSSLHRFRDFEFDGLKIDMSFVHNFHEEIDRSVIENIADLGQRLGVPVLAEGIETSEQLDFLRSVEGCAFGQGYHLARPEPFADFRVRLAERVSRCGALFPN